VDPARDPAPIRVIAARDVDLEEHAGSANPRISSRRRRTLLVGLGLDA
jgi:hypothetical protein